ncbi:VOC family protein [Dyella choica]|uniref:VOC family protein n=1 Tax=Dyella choica TaxID=1927959 RepID=A0A3S0S2H2_9GAMM|nr:VOC family protein [Dyella choica]RUL78880.1 VOC family protein [Dyella choica]
MSVPSAIEVVTLFVDDITQAMTFYESVFQSKVMGRDEVSCLLDFGGIAVNLLQRSEAPELIEPLPVAPATAGSHVLLTIKVTDVDATCAMLQDRGVRLLNGPVDRPWGRRTAAFADPSGHVWEVAQELG